MVGGSLGAGSRCQHLFAGCVFNYGFWILLSTTIGIFGLGALGFAIGGFLVILTIVIDTNSHAVLVVNRATLMARIGWFVEPRPGLLMCWRIRAHRRFATPHVVTLPVNSCCQNLRPGIDV